VLPQHRLIPIRVGEVDHRASRVEVHHGQSGQVADPAGIDVEYEFVTLGRVLGTQLGAAARDVRRATEPRG
jgi:hypothetical protein